MACIIQKKSIVTDTFKNVKNHKRKSDIDFSEKVEIKKNFISDVSGINPVETKQKLQRRQSVFQKAGSALRRFVTVSAKEIDEKCIESLTQEKEFIPKGEDVLMNLLEMDVLAARTYFSTVLKPSNQLIDYILNCKNPDFHTYMEFITLNGNHAKLCKKINFIGLSIEDAISKYLNQAPYHKNSALLLDLANEYNSQHNTTYDISNFQTLWPMKNRPYKLNEKQKFEICDRVTKEKLSLCLSLTFIKFTKINDSTYRFENYELIITDFIKRIIGGKLFIDIKQEDVLFHTISCNSNDDTLFMHDAIMYALEVVKQSRLFIGIKDGR